MANCTINDLILAFDKENRLRNTIGRVTGFDINKAYVLASFLQDKNFKEFLFKNIQEKDFLKDSYVPKEEFTNDDYVKINQNKLGALLNTHYINTYHSVNNSKTAKALGNLNGFSSGSAKTLAKQHTADLIIQEYRKEIVKPKELRRSAKDIIADVNRIIIHNFYREVDKFAQNVLSSDNYSSAAKEYAKKYTDLNDSYDTLDKKNDVIVVNRDALNKEISHINEQLKSFKKQYNDAAKKKDIDTYNEYKNKYDELSKKKEPIVKKRNDYNKTIESINKELDILWMDKYVIAQNLVNLYTNNYDAVTKVTLRNYANLVAQTKGDADFWYFQVFNTKAMTSIVKEFSKVEDIEEYLEEQDTNNDTIIDKYNGESVDETTKSWEENLYNNFNQIVNGRLKMILSTMPKLSTPYNYNSNVQSHDINNELGVTTYMDAQFVTVQIFSFGNFTNVDTLIESIREKSATVKSLYGLGQLVNMMDNDRCFANFVYANFAKPIVRKTILTISDISASDGISFDYSNPTAFHKVATSFNMINKLRATYNSAYNLNHLDVIKEINFEVDEYKKFIRKNGKTNRVNEKRITKCKELTFNLLSTYFPNIDKDIFNDYFDNNKASSDTKIDFITGHLKRIIKYIQEYKDTINTDEAALRQQNETKYNEYRVKRRKWLELTKEERDKTPEPVRPKNIYLDYSKYKFRKSLTSDIIALGNELAKYTESKANLNSVNAEGNTASDVIKNCFVTRFFDQILAEDEDDSKAGLRALLKYITQGAETVNGVQHVNQYSNNPLFFGLKDENGKVIRNGMFIRTTTGYDINNNAKSILKYSLFDGTRNIQDKNGAGYSSLSKNDYLITQYEAYFRATEEYDEGVIDNKDNYGIYAMRTASDAPKNFFIRAPRYTGNEIKYTFYNHLMDELNMFCNGLSTIMTKDGDNRFRTITNVEGVLGRALFHEKTADKIKQSNGTDFTKAITDGKRLLGNAFEFKRLFETNGYKASEEIEKALFLYGEGGLFIPNKDGSLSLNNDRILDITNKENNDTDGYNHLLIWDGSKFTINLNAAQKSKLIDIVNAWMKNFCSDSLVRTQDFKRMMEDNKLSYSDGSFKDFLLNTANMNMCYDDLFEGDFKYYNNARDFLKRTKEVQAGGDSYAGMNLLDDPTMPVHELIWKNQKEVIRVQSNKNFDENGNPLMENVTIDGTPLAAKNGWKAVTIYNTNKPSDYADELQKTLEDYFLKSGMKAKVAKERSTEIARGYGFSAADRSGDTTKINDAQSYITLEEFIRRKYADGTLQDYADLIRQLTDSTPVEDIDLTAINARIQVQKNFYYDKVFDAKSGMFYPRQIKNAEYVLIPKLIKGSDLEKVYNFMQKNGIGQLNTAETSKAAKKNVFTIWDAETGKFNENFEDNYDDSYAEDYFYKHLYKQQDVPQHMQDAENKAGSQITKKILDNIFNELDSNNPNREKLVHAAKDYQDAYTANIKESFEEFLDNMGWEYDEASGQIVNTDYATTDVNGEKLPEDIIKTNRETLNFSQLLARMREEAARLGMDSNFMDYLITDEFGNTIMPNCMNLVMNKLESVAQSIYNRKITRQTFPGWHAAQITNVGYSKNLEFDPKTGVMQVLLPRWSSLIPRGKNAEEDAAIIEQIAKESLDIHIGYRIPTEGKQSICVLKVVGFVNDCLGSTIVVPNDWVTQTGSDFDVDSVYGICWEMYSSKNKEGKIELHKIPYKEDEVDYNQLYIKYVNKRLDDKVKRTDLRNKIYDKVKAIKKELRDTYNTENENLNAEFKTLDDARNELYETKLPNWARGIIKDENKKAKKKERKDKVATDLSSLYDDINTKLAEKMDKLGNKLSEEHKEIVKQYMDYQTGLIKIMDNQDGLVKSNKDTYLSQKSEAINAIVEKAKKDYFNKIKKAAVKAGLETFEQWSNRDHIYKLDTKARNNLILDRMLEIMNDDSSREEQYGRSNFEKITNGEDGANDIIDKLANSKSRNMSPYNPIDQNEYFDDALSGTRLKAISVNWDTFVSKNNKMRTELSLEDTVDVIMTVGEKSAEDSVITYDEEELRLSYDTDIEDYVPKINTSKKPKFRIIPAKSVDKKAAIKASMANKYIGFANGINGSSTANYAEQAKQQNIPVNYGHYTKNDIVFVSIPGKRGDANVRKISQDLTIKEAIKALNAGATILTDTKSYTDSSDYNEGEKRLKANLEYFGYSYTEINGVGVWNKNNDFSNINAKLTNAEKEIVNDIDNNEGRDDAKETVKALNTNSELTNEEKEFIKNKLGNRPRVLVASETTDPVFHYRYFKNLVENELKKPAEQREFHMMYIITKHDGIPLKELAQLKIPKFVHFSITSLGGTKYEPGVMKTDDLLDRIEEFIKDGTLNPDLVTIRIDPIIPGVTKQEDIRHIIERSKAMGIKQFKFSIMDSYGYKENTKDDRMVIQNMKRVGYDWDTYYEMGKNGKYSYNAKLQYLNEIYSYMDNLAEEFNVNMWTCGEVYNIPLKKVRTGIGCLNSESVNKALGTTDVANQIDSKRKGCNCLSGKVNKLSFDAHCSSGCLYCYAKHGSDNYMRYYDENGNLLDNDYTRTVKKMNVNEQNPANEKDNINTQNTSKKRIVYHARKLGWSRNNRNTVGSLVTTYTSQTTAHHLDAVKMGSVPNVNEYTFNVYKLLTTLGIDFETAIGFIRQPAITSIIKNNNLINSVFFKSKNNPIKMAMADIAINMNLKYNGSKITTMNKNDEIIDSLKSNYNISDAFEKLFGIDIDSLSTDEIINIKIPLDKERLFTRIKRDARGVGDMYENAAFDLGMLLTFRNLQNTAKKVNNYIMTTSADKFGAHPSIRDSRKMINMIEEIRDDKTLSKENVSFINLIYPIDEFTGEINVDNSEYKSIAAIYKYVTQNSVKTSGRFFITEDEDFANAEEFVQNAIHHRFKPAEYKEYKRYAMAYMYNNIPMLLTPIKLDERGNIDKNIPKTEYNYWDAERTRIYGFGIVSDGNFNIENVNEPTDADIEKFAKLTPAQKVLFMQRHYPDNQGIFHYIKVTMINYSDTKRRGISRQYLAYDDQTDSIEDLYTYFLNSFSNHNPLIRMAAIDLIKYAFIAEGYNFKSHYISKIVPNSALYTEIESGGMDIINVIRNLVRDFPIQLTQHKFIDNFARSHSNMIPLVRMKDTSNTFNKLTRTDGLVHIDSTIPEPIIGRIVTNADLFKNAGGYVRVNVLTGERTSITTLYRVEARNPIYEKSEEETENKKIIGYKDYFLIPLNLLDSNETCDYSYNQEYNKYATVDYYDDVVEKLAFTADWARTEQKMAKERGEELIEGNNVRNPWYARNTANYRVIDRSTKVGKYTPEIEFDLAKDKFALIKAADFGDIHTKDAVEKLISGAISYLTRPDGERYTGYVQFNPSYQLKQLIPRGALFEQTFIIDNEDGTTESLDVSVGHYPMTPRFIASLDLKREGKAEPGEFEEALTEMYQTSTPSNRAELYRVSISKKPKEELDENAKKAATDLVIEEDEDSTTQNLLPRRGTHLAEDVSSAIISEISYNARKNNKEMAKRFMNDMNRHRVNRNIASSREANRQNIYKSAARYYSSVANELINKLNGFEINGEIYSMDDPEMYKALSKNTEYFSQVADVILNGITFGNRIDGIFKLDMATEDLETKHAIEEIINSINSVRQNNKLKHAMDNIINIYFKNYSTNPYIMDDFIKLREAFGDLDTIDSWFTDPSEIENAEAQVIIKQIYSMFNKAEMFDVKRNLKEYKDSLAEIEAMNESLDINKVIDFDNFRIRQNYNEQFIKDRNRIFSEYSDAVINKNNSKADFVKYLNVKYNRDKFLYETTEQRIEDEYYKRDLKMREDVMRDAGNLYVEYMMLSHSLYDTNGLEDKSEDELAEHKRAILSKMKRLKSNVDEIGTPKDSDEMTKVNALNKFLEERSKLQEEYFDTQEYEGFAETYKRYKTIVDEYNKHHANEPLDLKLNNVEYREAYNWIKSNGRLKFGKEQSKRLREAFNILTKRTTVLPQSTIVQLKKLPGVVDENGLIDGRKLTAEQIKLIYDDEMNDVLTRYDNPFGDTMLIKVVPSNIPVRNNKSASDPSTINTPTWLYKENKQKMELIKQINSIISKAFDKDTGNISMALMFNDDIVSEEERLLLPKLYKQLRNLRSELTTQGIEDFRAIVGNTYHNALNGQAHDDHVNYYLTNLKGTAKGEQFVQIFCDLRDDIEKTLKSPNPYIYGYYEPDAIEIDEEKTNARNYIQENVDFVPTEYYHLAKNEAIENGTFEEWFKANHIYNPYSHKFQPLKIWTTMEAKPGSELAESIEYTPTFDNMEKHVKEDKVNKKYQEFSTNYKKGNSKYDSNITLNEKEEALRNLLSNTMNKYATTYKGKRFVGQGYLPRERQAELNTRWALTQVGALLGYSWHSGSDSDVYHQQVDFEHDREADMNMLNLIKTKGSKNYISIPDKGTMSDSEYAQKVAEIREKNKKIQEENEKIDSKNLNRDWKEVMEHFIHNATIFNSRQAAKPYLYLLLEDLKHNDAYAIKGRWNKRSIKSNAGVVTTPQDRTREIIHTLTRRLLFEQHHENSTPRTVMNLLQNLTSAKYMIFNVYGGIANITTGRVNIAMEEHANEYFGYKEFMQAEKEYLSNILGYIANLYSDTSGSFTQAMIKEFNVVNFDDLLQFGSGTMGLDEKLKRIRNWSYSFQSMGEHYMQNSVLLAMTKTNRLYTDANGVQRIGDFKDFTWDVEKRAMFSILKNNQNLYINYKIYLESIKYDIDEKIGIVTNRKDFNRNYLYSLRDSTDESTKALYKQIAEKYYEKRKELLKTAKEEFAKFKTVESLYEFKDGKVNLKADVIKDFNDKCVNGKNPIGDLEHLLGGFKEKVIAVNKKIHGVYDKKGAAQIETKWWGSVLMQYHKHLWTGIMKRWRRRGYYSEIRGSKERGTYQTFIDFMGTEFTNFKDRVNNKKENGEAEALASIQVAMESIINSIHNIKFNWHNLSDWEQANIRRNLGDMRGVLVACLVVMALYGLYDDDDIKDDNFKSSLLYLADRLYSDSTMYSPIGLTSEYKTTWSSPIASANGPSDLLKAMMLIPKALFDPDYNPEYQSGLYAGQNKLMVLLKRNIPGVRPYSRIENITKNNKYYKIGNSQIGVNIAKNFGESLND